MEAAGSAPQEHGFLGFEGQSLGLSDVHPDHIHNHENVLGYCMFFVLHFVCARFWRGQKDGLQYCQCRHLIDKLNTLHSNTH